MIGHSWGISVKLHERNNGINMLWWIHLGITLNRILVSKYVSKGSKHQTTSWKVKSQTSAFILVKGQSDKLTRNSITWARFQLFSPWCHFPESLLDEIAYKYHHASLQSLTHFKKKKIYRSRVDLQYCVSFRCITKWIWHIHSHSFPYSFPI